MFRRAGNLTFDETINRQIWEEMLHDACDVPLCQGLKTSMSALVQTAQLFLLEKN